MPNLEKSTPLVQIFTLKDLPGRIGKSLVVPPGYQGIAIYADVERKVFPPGRHRILSAWKRVRGRGAGLRVGIVADGSLNLRVKAANLLSGDRELLDASLLCWAEIADPGKFFAQQVSSGNESVGTNIDLEPQAAQESLAPIASRFAAADLVSGLPTDRLLPVLQAALAPSLLEQGLQLQAIQFIFFGRAENRVAAAEKAFALQERLKELELQEKMSEIETQVQMDDFIRQLDDEFNGELGLRPVAVSAQGGADASETASPQENVLEAFRTWFKFETAKDEKGRHFRLDGLFRRSGQPKDEPAGQGRRYPKYWWRGRAIWMGFVLLVAVAITQTVSQVADDAPGPDRWGFVLAVWTFAVIALLESIKALYQKREALDELHWAETGSIFIDDLTGQNRLQADALVRQQCALDMENTGSILNDLRSRIYKAGDTDTALKIKTLEGKVQNYAADLQNPNFGQPPYVTDLKVSKPIWMKMLDYDEQLLVRSSAFSEDAHDLQQLAASGEFQAEQLNPLEGRLDAFRHRFANRSQALKASADEQKRFRMEI